MKKIVLSRHAVIFDSKLSSYKLVLEVISSEGINKHIFVKQRIRKPGAEEFDDVFAAIASPVQLEDLDINSPDGSTTYFRTSKIEITGSSSEFINEVFDAILVDIQRLVEDVEVLENLAPDGIYTIQSDQIEVDMGTPHTHYRIPLFAQPCGLNEVFTDIDSQDKQRVGTQDVARQGWLNDNYLTIYKFSYNIDTDDTLKNLWPLLDNLLPFASIEVNGIQQANDNILIDSTGIHWKDNLYGYAPWPKDYVNTGDTGSPENQLTIVFDFIK